MKNTQKGFTLIELLVVIAIIGILSSVVLASLNTARGKGADSAIKANLANIRAQAEIYYDANGNYGSQGTTTVAASSVTPVACGSVGVLADATVINQVKAAGAAVGAGTIVCGSTSNYWAVAVPLKTGGYWCVDSTGASKSVAGTPTNAWNSGCSGTLN